MIHTGHDGDGGSTTSGRQRKECRKVRCGDRKNSSRRAASDHVRSGTSWSCTWAVACNGCSCSRPPRATLNLGSWLLSNHRWRTANNLPSSLARQGVIFAFFLQPSSLPALHLLKSCSMRPDSTLQQMQHHLVSTHLASTFLACFRPLHLSNAMHITRPELRAYS